MANKTHLTTVTFNAVGVTAVGDVRCRASREASIRKPLGQDFSNAELGPMEVSGSMRLYFDKSDHSALASHLKNRTAAQTLVVTWNTGATWTGPAKITEFETVGEEDSYVVATVGFVADGSWLGGI